MSIFDSRVIVALMIAFSCVWAIAHHKGWAERDAEMQAEIAKKNEEARAKEEQLGKQLNEQSSKLLEANNAIDQKQSALDRAIRSGKLRFPTTSCVQANASTPAASGDRDQAGSESDRETLSAIAAIVAQGDRNTEQLNACITAYNQVKDAANGQRN